MNPLEHKLRDSDPNLTLDIPVADVLTRGDRYRRRRHRGVALGASGLVAVTTLGVLAVGGYQSGRVPSDTAGLDQSASALPGETVQFQVASWSGPSTNLSADQLAAVEAACSGNGVGLPEPGWDLPGVVAPVAVELRNKLVLAYFRQGHDYTTCALRSTGTSEFKVKAQTAGVEKPLAAGEQVATVTAGAADPGAEGGMLSDVYLVARTSPDVASLEISVAGNTYDTTTTDGLGFFWLPDDVTTQSELDQAVVTALDADGDVVYRSRPGESW